MVGAGAGGQIIHEWERAEEAGDTVYIRIRSVAFDPFAVFIAQ